MTRRKAHPGSSTKPILRFAAGGELVEVRRGHRRMVRGTTGWSCQHRPNGGGWVRVCTRIRYLNDFARLEWVLAAFNWYFYYRDPEIRDLHASLAPMLDPGPSVHMLPV